MTTVDEQKKEVETKVQEGMSQARMYGDRAYDELKARVDKLTDMVEERRGDVEEYARSNPISALGIAFLVGITAGAVIVAAASSSKR
jgi:ElaB/YqjD/DUF883 family membrane-anchored ribosome-binding protein